MADDLFKKWFREVRTAHSHIRLFRERTGARSSALFGLRRLLADHFVGEETVVKAGGYAKAAAIISNSLPTGKRTQSGDLGEILATEYLNSQTTYRVPIRKLRWKSDREMPMHGNDVIGIDTSGRSPKLLKGECKSRGNFTTSTVTEAVRGLDAHEGRPNPSTLAFITKRLYEAGRDAEAEVFRKLQAEGALKPKHVMHFVFALTGNDPGTALAAMPMPKRAGIQRIAAAVSVSDHGGFVAEAYQDEHGKKPKSS